MKVEGYGQLNFRFEIQADFWLEIQLLRISLSTSFVQSSTLAAQCQFNTLAT